MGRRKSVLEKQLEARLAREVKETKSWIALHDRLKLERGEFTLEQFLFLQRRAREERPVSIIPSDERLANFNAEKARTQAEEKQAEADATRQRDLDTLAERAAAVIAMPTAAPVVVRTPEEIREDKEQEQRESERRERERQAAQARERRAAIEAAEARLPKLRKTASLNALVRFTSNPADEFLYDVFVNGGLPESGTLQTKDASGSIVTLTTGGQHPGVMLPGSYLRVAKVEPSKLASLPEETQ